METLDDAIAHLGAGGGLWLALLAAVLLGLRHATDPDHLTAVSTLVMSDPRDGSRRAGRLGLAWGLGHATTLFAFGLPVVLVRRVLPEPVQQAAELTIGIVIIALAVRLLVRWRRGYLHTHPHRHGERWHAHPHVHEEAAVAHGPDHAHAHPEALGRSPRAAFGIGLVHGIGGSAGAGILLVGALPGEAAATAALALFAGATALSMALLSAGFGRALATRAGVTSMRVTAPAFGLCGMLFGVWYALGALGALSG